MDISYEMLGIGSVLTIYNGKYMLSNGILLDSFKETNRMLTMIYENTMEMLGSVPISIEWFKGNIEYLSFNPMYISRSLYIGVVA